MGLRKYLRRDRRRHPRHSASVDVEFHVWDAVKQQPLTGRVRGRLTDISPTGACLQTSHTLIDGHHVLLDNDPEGKTPLTISLPSPPEGDPLTVKAQVLWYNRNEANRSYQFDVGLKFVDLTTADRENLDSLLNSLASS